MNWNLAEIRARDVAFDRNETNIYKLPTQVVLMKIALDEMTQCNQAMGFYDDEFLEKGNPLVKDDG